MSFRYVYWINNNNKVFIKKTHDRRFYYHNYNDNHNGMVKLFLVINYCNQS